MSADQVKNSPSSVKRGPSGQNNDAPFFSVVVPTYNRVEVLTRAIQSVLRQTWADYELIIVDDGSTDDTRQAVEKINDRRLRYVWQENKGVSSARNAGVAVAHGRYVTFLDSDDEALPEWLESFAGGFEQNRTGIVFVGYIRKEEHNGQPRKTEIMPKRLGPLFSYQQGRLQAGTFAIRRSLFEAVGGYADGLVFAENTELLIRVVSGCLNDGDQVVSISKSLVIYNTQPTNGSHSLAGFKGRVESMEYILARHADKFREADRARGLFLTTAGVNAAKIDQYNRARYYFSAAIRAHPWNWKHYGRLLLALVPPLGRRLWRRGSSKSSR